MSFLLDTNICIAWLNGGDLGLRARIIQCAPEEISLCSIVKAELIFGAQNSGNRVRVEQVLERFFAQLSSLPFDDACAAQYGRLRALLEESGRIIGNNDLMIASIALEHGLTLVTRNEKEFGRVPGLRIEIW